MNLTNYEKTPIFRVFETVKREAARYGVSILESEIVGLVPAAALNAAAEFYLQIEGFNAGSGAREQAADCDAQDTELQTQRYVFEFLFVGAPRRRDAERLHLAIQVAALDAEHVGGARHVALLLGQRPQDEVALEPIARLVQRQPLAGAVGRSGARSASRSRKPRSAAEIASPGTMIISRSITLRSSRTLPGQG